MSHQTPIRRHKDGLLIKVYVQPRAAKNTIAGLHGGALKLRLTAAPVDGAANKMCLQFLAKKLNISKSALQIKNGHTSRTKTILCRCSRDEGSKLACNKVRTSIEALCKN